MNHERMLKVADAIEANPDHFSMADFYYGEPGTPYTRKDPDDALSLDDALTYCGTKACIAGWALHLWPAENDKAVCLSSGAAGILGLDYDDADEIFYNFDLETADEAAAYLRELVREDQER